MCVVCVVCCVCVCVCVCVVTLCVYVWSPPGPSRPLLFPAHPPSPRSPSGWSDQYCTGVVSFYLCPILHCMHVSYIIYIYIGQVQVIMILRVQKHIKNVLIFDIDLNYRVPDSGTLKLHVWSLYTRYLRNVKNHQNMRFLTPPFKSKSYKFKVLFLRCLINFRHISDKNV